MPISRSRSWVMVLVLVGAGLTVAAVALVLLRAAPQPDPRAVVSEAALEARTLMRPSRTQGLIVLREWDASRARAWATGDLEALRGLYTDEAEAGLADRAMLRRWIDRGLVVESLQTQVRGATVVTRSPRRLVIVVTDRVAGGHAVRGARRVALPRDRWSTRRIILKRVEGRWLVADVRRG